MLVGGLDQVRKRLKQQLGQYEYKQRCESLMIQSSNYYATTENSSFKCQEYDTPFFRLCETFDLFVAKGPPSFFLIFCNKLDFQKVQMVSPFTISKTLRFLSLRYSADFRRSRLVFSFHCLVSSSISTGSTTNSNKWQLQELLTYLL